MVGGNKRVLVLAGNSIMTFDLTGSVIGMSNLSRPVHSMLIWPKNRLLFAREQGSGWQIASGVDGRVKRLFDQHLSRRLVDRLGGFAAVSKDSDFVALSLRFGRPPLRVPLVGGHCSVNAMEAALRAHGLQLVAADADVNVRVVELAAHD